MFPSVTETQDITHGEAPSEAGPVQSLERDLFEPKGDTAAARPVLI